MKAGQQQVERDVSAETRGLGKAMEESYREMGREEEDTRSSLCYLERGTLEPLYESGNRPGTRQEGRFCTTKGDTLRHLLNGNSETGDLSSGNFSESRLILSVVERASVDRCTRELAEAELGSDEVLWRWAAYCLFYGWRDEETSLRVVPYQALQWIGGDGFRNTREVLEYVSEHLDVEVRDYISKRQCRLIVKDGLSPTLFCAVETDRARSKQAYVDRVLFLSGRRWTPNDPTEHRTALRQRAERLLAHAPTETAHYVLTRMNGRSSRVQARVLSRMEEARAMVSTMEIEVKVTPQKGETYREARARARRQEADLRSYYHRVLGSIEEQHQQFYAPSLRGRTDRSFALNEGVLMLPSRIRDVLLQDYHEIDLSSAHLRIAASLWRAPRLLEALDREGFSIWRELEESLDLRTARSEAKGALKAALYSAVYGMSRRGIQVQLSKALGRGVGARFLSHPLIVELLEARDRELESIERRGFAVTPDRLVFEITGDADAKSCLASVAQHIEQELMRVILEYEEGAKRFQVAFWIHDGCYVNMNRSVKTHLKRLNELLQERARALGVTARFEHTPPKSQACANNQTAPCETKKTGKTEKTGKTGKTETILLGGIPIPSRIRRARQAAISAVLARPTSSAAASSSSDGPEKAPGRLHRQRSPSLGTRHYPSYRDRSEGQPEA